MSFIAKYTDQLANDGTIAEGDKDLYEYGLKQGLLLITNLITVALIGYLFGLFWQSVVFMAAYSPLRSFAGGYHARTPLRCYLLSILLVIVSFGVVRYINWTETSVIIMLLMSCSIISYYSPTEDPNKPLDTVEMIVYKKRARITLVIEALIVLISILMACEELAVTILLSVKSI